MNFASLGLVRKLNVCGNSRILRCLQNTSPVTASSMFSTSSKCVNLSSESDFRLRHQNPADKSTSSNWFIYRAASAGLLGSLAGCYFFPGNPIVDFATVTLLVHHNYFGIKSVISDYGPLVAKAWFVQLMMITWLLISIGTLGLLYAFNYNNIGFSNAVVKFFKL